MTPLSPSSRLALSGAFAVRVTKDAQGNVVGVEEVAADRFRLLPDGALVVLPCSHCGGSRTLRTTSTWKDGAVTTTDEPCSRCSGEVPA